jgi:hypothetical protein
MAEEKRTVREMLEAAEAGDPSAMKAMEAFEQRQAEHERERNAIRDEFMSKIGQSFEEGERLRREAQAELAREAERVAQARVAMEADRIAREEATLEAIHSIRSLAEGFSEAAYAREQQSSDREARLVTMTEDLVKLTKVLTVLTTLAVVLALVSIFT